MCSINVNGMRMNIILNEIEKIKEFSRLVTTFESDINIIKGLIIYDAKSLLAIYDIDASKGAEIEIISSDINEITRFKEVMSQFKE